MPELQPRTISRLVQHAVIAVVFAAVLPLPGLIFDAVVRQQVDETQAAADRLHDFHARLIARVTGSSPLDLAEDVALRRALGEIIGVLQSHRELQRGLDQIHLRVRVDAWFEGREDPRLADDIAGALSTTVRAARARGRWSRQLALGSACLALFPAGAACLILIQVRRRLRQVAQEQERAMREQSSGATILAAPASSSLITPYRPESLPAITSRSAAAPATPPPGTPPVAQAVRPASSAMRQALGYVPPPSSSPRMPMPAVTTMPPPQIGPLQGRVLVVEDNPINQRVTHRQLTELMLQVEVVADGENALLKMHSESWDAVLMDLQLPGIDGLTATRRWREHEAREQSGRHLPIVAITANALGTDREACFAAGMDGYLAKPARLEDLHRALSRYLCAADHQVKSVEIAPASVPQTPATRELPALTDPALWAKLRSETARSDPRMLEELLLDLQQQAPQLLNELEGALAASDWERLRATAHRLKGSAGMLGLPRIATAAKALESASKMHEPLLAAEALAELQAALPATFAEPTVRELLVG